jgi:DNA-binding transcriptional ArsR family regulator
MLLRIVRRIFTFGGMSKGIFHPDRDQIDLSAVLEALSEPTRRQMVLDLMEQGEATCGGIGKCGSKPSTTYHLTKLREAGVTRSRIEGPFRYISLRDADLEIRFPGLLASVIAAARKERDSAPLSPLPVPDELQQDRQGRKATR